MLVEALSAAAGAGGMAVVQAAGTDVWTVVRDRIARLFGRGGTDPDPVVDMTVELLERDGAALAEAEQAGSGTELMQSVSEAWTRRLVGLLESADEDEQRRIAEVLSEAAQVAQQGAGLMTDGGSGAVAGDRGFAAAGDVKITATQSGVAAGVINGAVNPTNPPGAAGRPADS
ncbi:hypothetical protein AB0D04_04470 [Streptomyces sp. NPDC048483]|uniref:hypothetical protein n=1 Tax=Streptomyces sp. NPDC048483 TaxID=3154927 RepID=UPI00343E5F5E